MKIKLDQVKHRGGVRVSPAASAARIIASDDVTQDNTAGAILLRLDNKKGFSCPTKYPLLIHSKIAPF